MRQHARSQSARLRLQVLFGIAHNCGPPHDVRRPPVRESLVKPPDELPSGHPGNRPLLLLLVAVSLALGWILLPFYGSLMWGSIIAMLFAPVQRRLVMRFGGRRIPAALVTLAIVLLIVIVPLIIALAALASEATLVYQRIESGEWKPALYLRGLFDALPDWMTTLLGRFDLADFDTVERRLAAGLARASQLIATHALGIGQDMVHFVASLFITLYLAFFLIRDGDRAVRAIRRAIPLAHAHRQELIEKFSTVIRATVRGSLLVAAIQGLLGGIAFWFLEVGGALLWGVAMAFLSLVPAVGAALVWLPVAIYFLVSGAIWQGIALISYGVLVIGLADNVLRPMLVGRDTRMPDSVVMITTLGGMAALGINGFVLGPAIAAMFIAVWQIYGTTRPASE